MLELSTAAPRVSEVSEEEQQGPAESPHVAAASIRAGGFLQTGAGANNEKLLYKEGWPMLPVQLELSLYFPPAFPV